MILLDSSIVIELVEQGRRYKACLERLLSYEPSEVRISVLTVFEVEAGLFDGSPNIRRRRAQWRTFAGVVQSEFFTDGAAIEAARIVRETAAAGYQLGKLDAMIAATAIEFGYALATLDRDFSRVADLEVEQWGA